mgnify:CR=1 FL=1
MVSERAGLEKLFISATYDKMKRRFYAQILIRLQRKSEEEAQELILPTINADVNSIQGDEDPSTREAESTECSDDEEATSEGEGSGDSGTEGSYSEGD